MASKFSLSRTSVDGVRLRLLGQDNVGIVPCYETLHRADQHFDRSQHVYDVLHYADMGRAKRRLEPLTAWEPLPLLKPREV